MFVSGTTGFDYATMTILDDAAGQTEQCLRNIEAALAHGVLLGGRDAARDASLVRDVAREDDAPGAEGEPNRAG